MLTFALDTSTASPSLALVRDESPIAELWLSPEPGSGRRVLEAAHGLLVCVGLAARDIDEIVVGVGPGGFTGLRIGLATALGLGQALRVPVTGASSLEALALGIAGVAPEGALVAPVQDARRRELFAALYRVEAAGMNEILAPVALAASDLAERLVAMDEPVWVAGVGVGATAGALEVPGVTTLAPGSPVHRLAAAALVRRVRGGGGIAARPVYARLPDAEVARLNAIAAAGA